MPRFDQGGGVRGHCRFGVGELAALTWLPDLVAHARDMKDIVIRTGIQPGEGLDRKSVV